MSVCIKINIPVIKESMDTNSEPISAYAVYSRAGKRKREKGVLNLNNKIVSNGVKLQNNISVRKPDHNKHKAQVPLHIKKSDSMKKLFKEHIEVVDKSDVLKKKKKKNRKSSSNSLSESRSERSDETSFIIDSKVNKMIKEKSGININSKVQKKEKRVDSPYVKNMNTVDKKDYSKFHEHKDDISSRSILEETASSDKSEEEEIEGMDSDVVDVEDDQNETTDVSDEEELMDEDAVSLESEEQQKQNANERSSIDTGKELFEWIIKPVEESRFMSDYWEKQPLVVTHNQKDYYTALISTPIMDKMLRDNVVYFGKHVDVTSYSDGKRETHNQDGRAQSHVVWDYYTNGCSVRLLNPQAFIPKIHTLNTNLQEYFGCFVGANVYLTPAGSQGFAPHYDDIEAFVLQIEGKKRWRLYAPRNKNEELPRFSSQNFAQDEIGMPILDVVLKAGDLLYFPRGYIHQAVTLPDSHSLHITLSVYQKTAWIDLLEKALPEALIKAAKEDVEYRKGLPHRYLHSTGLARNKKRQQHRKRFISKAKELVKKLVNYLDMDSAVDKMGTQFMHDALPPVLIPDEVNRSVYGGGLTVKKAGKVSNRIQIDLNTQVKLIRAHCCRLIEEEEEFRLYHSVDNSLEYHAEDPQYLVIPSKFVHIVKILIARYPDYIKVQNIPHSDEEKLCLISDLWDHGLLLTSTPLESIDSSIGKKVSIDDDED